MISSSAQFPGPDVDECTFPGPDALTSDFPGVDFAVVVFPPAPMPVIEGVAHFTGVGYLTVDVFGIAKVAALFSGSGSATADSIAWGGVKQAVAMFSGSGDFTVIARAVQRATYSGSGSLAAKIATAPAAALSGSGQAAFASSAIGIAPFTLNGEGTATATVVAVGGAYSVSANFTGEGSATAKVVPTITAGFSGSGSASATVASAIKSLFNGSGTNAAKVVSAMKADFTGSGTSSATMVKVGESYTDNFNRASLGSDWGVYSPLPIISGSTKMQAGAPSFNQAITCFPMWAQELSSNNQSVLITLVAPTGTLNTNGACAVGGYLRATGTANSGTMVAFQAYGTSVAILSKSGSTFTQRATGTTTTVSATDQYELQADGNVYTVYKNGVATNCSWTDVGNLMTTGSLNRRGGALVMSANNANTSYAAQYSMAIDEFTLKDI